MKKIFSNDEYRMWEKDFFARYKFSANNLKDFYFGDSNWDYFSMKLAIDVHAIYSANGGFPSDKLELREVKENDNLDLWFGDPSWLIGEVVPSNLYEFSNWVNECCAGARCTVEEWEAEAGKIKQPASLEGIPEYLCRMLEIKRQWD